MKKKNRFWGFVVKEYKHIFRDPRTLLLVIFMPIIQMVIFGYVVSNEITNAGMVVADFSGNDNSQRLIDKFASSGYFRIVKRVYSIKDVDAVFRHGDAKIALVIGSKLPQNEIRSNRVEIQLLTDASEPNIATVLDSYARAVIRSFYSGDRADGNANGGLTVQTRMLYNSELKAAFMFVPGTMVMILMLITAMMTSISITREKELGTMEVLLVSPLKPAQIVIGKVIPYVVLGFFNSVVILAMGYTVFGLPLRGSLLLIVAVSFLFILLALSLGIFISTVSKTQQVAMFISMFALMLPTILLTGFIFPIENMPEWLQWLSLLIPPRWFLSALKTLMIKGQGFYYVWKELLIMLGMTVLFIILSIKKFKIRLE